MSDENEARIVWVTGPSGAGRSTAINALEDLGFEAIDNLPLSLLDRLLDGPPPGPLALGLDARNRDFAADTITATLDRMSADPRLNVELLYLDCRTDVLIQRYSETRRRHPLAPDDAPEIGISREMDLLVPLRARAAAMIDTSEMTPHDLRAEIERHFGADGGSRLSVSVQSFSYKRGLPRGVDIVFDVRFLRNPHWDPALRTLDGRTPEVADYVIADPRYPAFFDRIVDLILTTLPFYLEEGKTSLAIGFGCTGGQHRSVALAEKLAAALAEREWQVSTRHRELERRATASTPV